MDGIEIELTITPVDGLNIFANLATAWSNYQELDDAALAGRVELGDMLPGTPELTGGDRSVLSREATEAGGRPEAPWGPRCYVAIP